MCVHICVVGVREQVWPGEEPGPLGIDWDEESCLAFRSDRACSRFLSGSTSGSGQAVLPSAGASVCPISLQVHGCSHLPPPLSQPSEILHPSWERKVWLLASQLWSGPLSPHEAINYPIATSLELGESPGSAIPWFLYSKWSSLLSNPVQILSSLSKSPHTPHHYCTVWHSCLPLPAFSVVGNMTRLFATKWIIPGSFELKAQKTHPLAKEKDMSLQAVYDILQEVFWEPGADLFLFVCIAGVKTVPRGQME